MRIAAVLTLLAGTLALPVALAAQEAPLRVQNVRLTFHLIGANGAQRPDPEIEPVITELRRLFRFNGYRLMAKSVLQATSVPSSSVQQQLVDDQGRPFVITAEVGSVDRDIHLSVKLFYNEAGSVINAAVRLQDGRTVVLGTANVSSKVAQDTGALILVVTPVIN